MSKAYPALKPQILDENTPLIDEKGNTVAKVVDFWKWAYSDLVGNTERGALAEYIVACSMGVEKKERVAWDKYDLLSPEGIAVEVKASGYIQTWEQDKLSAISFGIQPTYGWDSVTNEYAQVRQRQSDVYVFCVHKHIEQETINPLDTSQWDFYVLATHVLNEKVGEQKRISISALQKLGAEKCSYETLHNKIVTVHRYQV